MGVSLKEARVVITGGASGIGLALAKRMAAEKASIALCDVNPERIDGAVNALLAAGAGDAFGTVIDVTDGAALESWVTSVIDRLGGIDVGWNNAGIGSPPSAFHEISVSDYHHILSVNLHAVFHGSQLFVKQMIKQGTPALILNTGSENSLFFAVPGTTPYVISKMGVAALTEGLALDVPDHIDVKLLCPGFVSTALGPEAMMALGMDVEAFADAVYPRLQSDDFYIISHGFNAKRIRDRTDRMLSAIEKGAVPADQTAQYDLYNILGLDDLGRPKRTS